MAYDRFIIAPADDGLQSDVKPWLISDHAFSTLNNAYVFRGRLRRRIGSQWMRALTATGQAATRLKIKLGTTHAVTGNFSGTVPGLKFKIGQAFSIPTDTVSPETWFTVVATGTPADMLSNGTATATYNTTTGAVAITAGPLNKAVYFYPSEPVMGFVQYADGTANVPTYAFDTQFAYGYDPNGWYVLGPIPATIPPAAPTADSARWTGSDSEFFWSTTWRGALQDQNILFVTNEKEANTTNQTDGIFTYDSKTNKWTQLAPVYDNAGHKILGAALIVPFKGCLVLIDTLEDTASGTVRYKNRARLCQNGSPFQADAWNQDIPGKGFFIDAPTKDIAITCQFLKDHLIVFFDNSTWELVWTSNNIYPVVWQQINTELGAQSTFSEVPFDQQVLGVGRVGIHSCTGANVSRIDTKIPDEVFNVSRSNDGIYRVAGIRDYYLEMVYWSLPDHRIQDTYSSIYPNRILAYNYRNDSWSFYNDSITAFGYFEQQIKKTWGSTTTPWGAATFPWASPSQNVDFKQIIAGNQEGWTFIVTSDETNNAPALQITNITNPSGHKAIITAVNHNLNVGDYVAIADTYGVGPVSQDIINGGSIIGTTDPLTGNFSATVTINPTGIGQQFSIGTEIFTVVANGSPSLMTSNGSTPLATFDNATGDVSFAGAALNAPVYYYPYPSKFIAQVSSVTDVNTFTIVTDNFTYPVPTAPATTSYLGHGTIERVTPFDVWTKQYNFYTKQGKNCFVPKIDFFLTRTDGGELTVDYYTSSQTTLPLNFEGGFTGSIEGTSTLETSPYLLVPYEQLQDRVWHPIYLQADGESVQMRLYMTDAQITDPTISQSDFELHGMVIYALPVSRLQ